MNVLPRIFTTEPSEEYVNQVVRQVLQIGVSMEMLKGKNLFDSTDQVFRAQIKLGQVQLSMTPLISFFYRWNAKIQTSGIYTSITAKGVGFTDPEAFSNTARTVVDSAKVQMKQELELLAQQEKAVMAKAKMLQKLFTTVRRKGLDGDIEAVKTVLMQIFESTSFDVSLDLGQLQSGLQAMQSTLIAVELLNSGGSVATMVKDYQKTVRTALKEGRVQRRFGWKGFSFPVSRKFYPVGIFTGKLDFDLIASALVRQVQEAQETKRILRNERRRQQRAAKKAALTN